MRFQLVVRAQMEMQSKHAIWRSANMSHLITVLCWATDWQLIGDYGKSGNQNKWETKQSNRPYQLYIHRGRGRGRRIFPDYDRGIETYGKGQKSFGRCGRGYSALRGNSLYRQNYRKKGYDTLDVITEDETGARDRGDYKKINY